MNRGPYFARSVITAPAQRGHSIVLCAEAEQVAEAFRPRVVLFGIGAGWLREESEILGADFPHRWGQTREYIAAMRQLWTKDEASFAGQYVKFSPVRFYPKPKQPGGPPILIGSNHAKST